MGILNTDGTKKRKPPKNSSETRKVRKPLIEKKRRDRINTCLLTLAELISSPKALKNTSKPTKLEKADILELTVKFWNDKKSNIKEDELNKYPKLEDSQNSQSSFGNGYSHCIHLVDELLTGMIAEQHSPATKDDISNFKSDLIENLIEARENVKPDDEMHKDSCHQDIILMPRKLEDGTFALVMDSASIDTECQNNSSMKMKSNIESMWRPW